MKCRDLSGELPEFGVAIEDIPCIFLGRCEKYARNGGDGRETLKEALKLSRKIGDRALEENVRMALAES